MKLFVRISLMALLFHAVRLTGCIGEDMANCPARLRVYFTYDPATYARTGINEAEVDKVDIFAFDAQGIFRGVWIDDAPVLTPDYHVSITGLPGGEYRFVAWCSVRGRYKFDPADFVVGRTTFSESLLILEHQGEVVGGVSPLFHAGKTEYVGNTGEQKIYMPLVQAHNTINLTTEGLQDNTDTYRMTIRDDNGKYYFDCSFAGGDEFSYAATCGKDAAGQLSASLRVLKLAADRSPLIEIANETKGTTLFRKNLVTLISETGDNDYDVTHTYDIHLKFGLGISVSINGWWVVNDGETGLI